MTIWDNTVSKNRLIRKVTDFMSQITRTNFGLSRRPVVFNLTISWFPSYKIFDWTINVIYQCINLSGSSNIIKNFTNTLDLNSIEKHIARAVYGHFLYGYSKLTVKGTSLDTYEYSDNLKLLSQDRSFKVLTGTEKILKLMPVSHDIFQIYIPTISGTGNVKNKRDIFAGKLVISVSMKDGISDFISDMKSGPYGKYFNDTTSISDVTRTKFSQDFALLEHLADSGLLRKWGILELNPINFDPSFQEQAPILSYFGYITSKNKKMYEYTMLDSGLSIFTIAACQIFNFIPGDKTVHGCTNTSIDLNYFQTNNFNISSQKFSDDILPKLYVVDEFDASSLSDEKKNLYTERDLKTFQSNIPYLNSVHKHVIAFIFCGLSVEDDISYDSYTNNGNYNSNVPGKPGPSKPSAPKPSKGDSPKPDSSEGEQSEAQKDLFSPKDTSIFDENTLDNTSSQELMLKPTGHNTFGIFRNVSGVLKQGISIVSPTVGTALNLGEKALTLYYHDKPRPNIIVDNKSLIGQMNNEFSIVPNIPLRRLKR